MPSVEHEAPLELLRGDPGLAAVLVESLGIPVPAGYRARLADGDVTAAVPAQLLTDKVILLLGKDAAITEEERARRKKRRARNAGVGELAVIVEVQRDYDEQKWWTWWPAYLAQVRAQYLCDTVLAVICPDPAVAARYRQPIATGHPGFDLTALIIDRDTIPPPPSPGTGQASPELTVLAVLTGAVDLDSVASQHQVLASLRGLSRERLETYTVFIRRAASPGARKSLENLMTTAYRDTFVEGLLAEGEARGEAKGEARTLLRVLEARGLQVPDDIREQVLACTNTAQLEEWIDRAATATSVDDVFSRPPASGHSH